MTKRLTQDLLVLCVVVVSSIGVFLYAPSCTTMSSGERSELIARSEALEAEVEAQREAQLEALARAKAENDARAAEKAQKALTLLDKMLPLVQSGHAVLEASLGEDGTINLQPGAVALGASIGGPVGAMIPIAALLGTNIWTLLAKRRREAEARADLESVAVALDKVSIKDKALDASLNAHWPTVEENLSATAKAVINEKSVT